MKLKILLLFHLLFSLSILAQESKVRVEALYLARDDGKGKVGETVPGFFTDDIPIHCVVQLDSLKPVTVKMIFVAVKVAGVKPETKVITSKYATNGYQTQVYFTGKPEKNWVAGIYRIDIFIEDTFAENLEFKIQKRPQQSEREKILSPKAKKTGVKKLGKS